MPKSQKGRPNDDLFYEMSVSMSSKITRIWFDLMTWLTLTGALLYIYEKTNNVAVGICLLVSSILLVSFIQVPIQVFIEKRWIKGSRAIAYGIAFIGIFLLFKLFQSVVQGSSFLSPT